MAVTRVRITDAGGGHWRRYDNMTAAETDFLRANTPTERLATTDAVDWTALIYCRALRHRSACGARNWARAKYDTGSYDAARGIINVLAVHHGICGVRGRRHEPDCQKGK